MKPKRDQTDEELRAEAASLEERAQRLEGRSEVLRDEASLLEHEARELTDDAKALRTELDRRAEERANAKRDAALRPGFGDHWPALFPEKPTGHHVPVAMDVDGEQWVTNGHVLVRPLERVELGGAPDMWRAGHQRYADLMASSEPAGEVIESGERTTRINGTTYATRYVDLLTHLADEPLRLVAHEQDGSDLRLLVAFRGGKPSGLAMPMRTWEDDR